MEVVMRGATTEEEGEVPHQDTFTHLMMLMEVDYNHCMLIDALFVASVGCVYCILVLLFCKWQYVRYMYMYMYMYNYAGCQY